MSAAPKLSDSPDAAGRSLAPASGSAALTGECTFYRGGTKVRPISIRVRDGAHRVELLNGLCNDPEVEGFEITWDKPQNE